MMNDAHSVIKIHNLPNAFHDRSNSPKDNWPRMPVTGRIEPCRAGCWQGGECTPYNGLYTVYLFWALGISKGRELVSSNIWKSRKIYHAADYPFFWKTPLNPRLSIGRHYSFCSVVDVIPCQPRHVNLLDICRWSTRFITLDCPWIPLKGGAIFLPIFFKKNRAHTRAP